MGEGSRWMEGQSRRQREDADSPPLPPRRRACLPLSSITLLRRLSPLLEMSETSPSAAAGEVLRAGGLETQSALPCACQPPSRAACRRSYKKRSPSTIGDITQQQQELDSARCQESYGPTLPRDRSPWERAGVYSTGSREGWVRLVEGGWGREGWSRGTMAGGRHCHWRFFKAWGTRERSWEGVEAR